MGHYRDRHHAGRVLASALDGYASEGRLVVLALPAGGVPVGYEVARRLEAPLDVFVVRKLGVPGRDELAMGALASGGALVFNEDIVFGLGIPDEVVGRIVSSQRLELARREEIYRGDRPAVEVAGATALLVDDGLAAGATMRAAVEGLRQLGASRIVIGVPIAASSAFSAFEADVDEIVCAAAPEPFVDVERWYEDAAQTSDEDVRRILEVAWSERRGRLHGSPAAGAP